MRDDIVSDDVGCESAVFAVRTKWVKIKVHAIIVVCDGITPDSVTHDSAPVVSRGDTNIKIYSIAVVCNSVAHNNVAKRLEIYTIIVVCNSVVSDNIAERFKVYAIPVVVSNSIPQDSIIAARRI